MPDFGRTLASSVRRLYVRDWRSSCAYGLANGLGETHDLEDPEDCRSAGGHGNQHVRLRGAQITKRSARLDRRSVAASRGRRDAKANRSSVLRVEEIQIGAAIGEIGEIARRGFSFRRPKSRLQRVHRIEI